MANSDLPTPSPSPTPIAKLEGGSKTTPMPSQTAVTTVTRTPQVESRHPASHLSAPELAEEIAKRLRGSQPQLHIIREKAIDLADEIAQFDRSRKSLVARAQIP